MSDNARAWALACKLFAAPQFFPYLAFPPEERELLPILQRARALTMVQREAHLIECPRCMGTRGRVVNPPGGDDRLAYDCPGCGVSALSPQHRWNYSLDTRWLATQLRLALGLHSAPAAHQEAEGVWHLGLREGAPVMLARGLRCLLFNLDHFADLIRAAPCKLWLIAPDDGWGTAPRYGATMSWLPLEEQFTLYGDRVRLVEAATALDLEQSDASPRHGPFSADFAWVTLPQWPQGPIALRKSQAAIFRALWSFEGVPRSGEEVMRAAGLDSERPGQLFKVRREHKGDPAHEGPSFAFRELVRVQQREGRYHMPCAVRQSQRTAAGLDVRPST